jgi:hypothetical protein
MTSKARSLARAIRTSPVLISIIEEPENPLSLAAALTTATAGEIGKGGSDPYLLVNDLPDSDNEVGNLAFVEETNSLYIWAGDQWLEILTRQLTENLINSQGYSKSSIEYLATSNLSTNEVVMLNTNGTVSGISLTTYPHNGNIATNLLVPGSNYAAAGDDSLLAGFPNNPNRYAAIYQKKGIWYTSILDISSGFSYGGEYNMNSIDNIDGYPYMLIHPDDPTKILILYTSSSILHTLQGTILGTAITWGTPEAHPTALNTGTSYTIEYDFAGSVVNDRKIIFSYEQNSVLNVMRVSWDGTSVTYSSPIQVTSPSGTLSRFIAWDPSTEGRFVTNISNNQIIGGLVNWTTNTSIVGGSYVLGSNSTKVAFDPLSGKIVASYRTSNSFLRQFSMDESYVILPLGTAITWDSNANSYTGNPWDLKFIKNSDTFILPYNDQVNLSNEGYVKVYKLNGTGFTQKESYKIDNLDQGAQGFISIHPSLSGQAAISYIRKRSSSGNHVFEIYVRFMQGEYSESTLEKERLIGITNNSGTLVDVTLEGEPHPGLTGLLAGSLYYVRGDGSISNIPDEYNAKIGKALRSDLLSLDFT